MITDVQVKPMYKPMCQLCFETLIYSRSIKDLFSFDNILRVNPYNGVLSGGTEMLGHFLHIRNV